MFGCIPQSLALLRMDGECIRQLEPGRRTLLLLITNGNYQFGYPYVYHDLEDSDNTKSNLLRLIFVTALRFVPQLRAMVGTDHVRQTGTIFP